MTWRDAFAPAGNVGIVATVGCITPGSEMNPHTLVSVTDSHHCSVERIHVPTQFTPETTGCDAQ